MTWGRCELDQWVWICGWRGQVQTASVWCTGVQRGALISDLTSQLKTDSLCHPVVYLPQSQGSQCCQYPSEQFGGNRYRCMCLCKTWVLCASFGGGLPKGRKVCKDQCATDPLPILHKVINMDYSICNALAYHTEPMNSALIIYDVACQWSINFHRHVQDSHFLSLPHITDLIPVVGKRETIGILKETRCLPTGCDLNCWGVNI